MSSKMPSRAATAVAAFAVVAGSLLATAPVLATSGQARLDLSASPTATAEGFAVSTVAGAPASTRGRLDVGSNHTCLVVSDGSVRCWGSNPIGDGSFVRRPMPTRVAGISDAVEVALGSAHGCVLRSTGGVSCWGSNGNGQLGNGTTTGLSNVPVAVPISGVTQIAAASSSTCALISNGTVKCWGSNAVGQIGNNLAFGTNVYVPSPTTVFGVSGATSIAMGGGNGCAVLSDGTARCWGTNFSQQLGGATQQTATSTPVQIPGVTGIKSITAGGVVMCALLVAGTVTCWGDDTFGEIGDGGVIPGSTGVPPTPVIGLSGVVAIDAGQWHVCAVLVGGTVKCWGRDQNGQLGDGLVNPTSTPFTVPGVASMVDVSGDIDDTCALDAAGNATCWGANNNGQLGRFASATANGPGLVQGNLGSGQVTAGSGFSCALLATRTIKCWGAGDQGQLGDGIFHTGPQVTPVAVKNLTDVVAISAGTNHACALTSAGRAWCWGVGADGQLGNKQSGAGIRSNVPVAVVDSGGAPLTGLLGITAGGSHTCAITATLGAMCWGRNDKGQLGDGTVLPRSSAVNVVGSTLFVSISAGSQHTCAVSTSNDVWCWGDNANLELGYPFGGFQDVPVKTDVTATAVQVVARYQYSCALKNDGTIRCWGWDGYGALGQPGLTDSAASVAVTGVLAAYAIAPSSNHGVHTCAAMVDSTVRCWGANDQGQDGKGSLSADEPVPVEVAGLTGAIQVSVGFQHSCALRRDGGISCWGNNAAGQLGSSAGNPDATATPVTGFNVGVRATAIEAGTSHTCALVSNGTARCWGAGSSGRLGNASTSNRSTPVTVSGLSAATAISAGGAHTCAIVAGGTARCWGYNGYGQLGNNTVTSHSTPVTVSGLSGAIAISAGGNHTCALLSNGTVKCWGLNSSGQLGDGTTTSRHVPVTVKTSSTGTLSGVIAISAGSSHTCALLSNGTARCWGAGSYGRLGNGSTANRGYASTSVSGVTTATAVASRFTSISAGGAHTCARIANGTAKCWGDGASGRLGNASTANHTTPVTVSGLTSVAQVSAGGAHSCALLSNGTARCWGSNASGQLGTGSTTSHSSPVTVSGLTGATSISAGGNHTAATLATGSLRAWGLNSSGQVGDGTTTNRTTPRGVSGF